MRIYPKRHLMLESGNSKASSLLSSKSVDCPLPTRGVLSRLPVLHRLFLRPPINHMHFFFWEVVPDRALHSLEPVCSSSCLCPCRNPQRLHTQSNVGGSQVYKAQQEMDRMDRVSRAGQASGEASTSGTGPEDAAPAKDAAGQTANPAASAGDPNQGPPNGASSTGVRVRLPFVSRCTGTFWSTNRKLS
jgi:hypothetical protein